jgi:hypothetical protein
VGASSQMGAKRKKKFISGCFGEKRFDEVNW